MQGLLNFIQHNAPWLVTYKYFFLFLGALTEGMNSLVLGGFLASVGQAKLYFLLPLFIAGHIINGYFWYGVGFWGGSKSIDRWGRKDERSRKVIETIENYFKRYSGRAIMFAKFTFSLEIATLIMSGSLKYNLKQFSRYNFYGSLGWVGITVAIGYFFGESFQLFYSLLKNFTLALVFLGGAMVLVYLLSLLFKKYYLQYLFIQQRLREWTEKVKEELDSFLSNGEDHVDN